MSALSFQAVSHRFGGTVAADGIGFDVAAGEIVCLLGPSGCGKSTLLRLAAGLETIQAGRIAIDGKIVSEPGRDPAPPEARGIGFLFQDYALFPHLSVFDNVAFGLHGVADAEKRRRGMESLAQVGMAEFAGAFPHTLSGGQQQRVALARAMAPKPRLFLLDEPFSGLDARLRRRILEETWRLLKASGAASLVVTHDPEEANLIADRIAIMRAGKLLQIGTPDQVYSRPNAAFVCEFLGETNALCGVAGADGRIETALGPVAANGLAPGATADVFIRHYGITVYADDAAPPGARPARVVRIRSLGATRLFELAVEGLAGALHARVSARVRAAEGDRVSVVVNPSEVFVFPSETTT